MKPMMLFGLPHTRCPVCQQPVRAMPRRICTGCKKPIRRHDKWTFTKAGRVKHRNCKQPESYLRDETGRTE